MISIQWIISLQVNNYRIFSTATLFKYHLHSGEVITATCANSFKTDDRLYSMLPAAALPSATEITHFEFVSFLTGTVQKVLKAIT